MRLPLLVVSATILAVSPSARADAIYSYAGQELVSSYYGEATPPAFLIGSITLAQALQPNTTYSTVNPLDFDFETELDAPFSLARVKQLRYSSYSFQDVSTDTHGDISRFNIGIRTGRDYITLEDEGLDSPRYDTLHIYPQPGLWTSTGPGTFSTPATSATPEPSSFALFGTGLLCMTGLLHKRGNA